MTIEELLRAPDRLQRAGAPEMDALREADALADCALLSVSYDSMEGTARLLFDCRGALQLEAGNVAVVVVHDVSELRWSSSSRVGWLWHAVMGSRPELESGNLSFTAGLEPDATLRVVGSGGEFYVGNVPGGDAPPPDFTRADADEIRRGLANWSSEFDVVGVSSA